MKSFERCDRVARQLQQTLSDLLKKNVQDPRIKMATITEVKLSRDLRIAKIYFTIYGGEKNKDDAIDGFKSALGYVKRKLASELKLRYMPDLRFYFDESFDYSAHINNVLKSLDKNCNQI